MHEGVDLMVLRGHNSKVDCNFKWLLTFKYGCQNKMGERHNDFVVVYDTVTLAIIWL